MTMTFAEGDEAGLTPESHDCDRLSPGEQIEWALFFERDYGNLVKLCLLRGCNREDAEDGADTAMLAVRRGWRRIVNRGAYARKVATTHAAQLQKRRHEEAEKYVEKGLHLVHNDADEQLSNHENSEWIKQLLDCLPRTQRAVMEGICAGLTTAEIAEHLGKKPATIRKHLQLARRRLNDELRLQGSQNHPDRTDLSTGKENR